MNERLLATKTTVQPQKEDKDGAVFKEDVMKHAELQKLEKEEKAKNKGDEERKLKQQLKEQ